MNIFSLLKVITVDVSTNWIEAKDLVHLDSAFCDSTSRCFLLGLFEQEYFTLGENSISTECLKYVSGRKLKLKSLSLNDSFGSRKLIQDLTTSKIRSLKIVGCKQWKLPRADLVSLFNACSMLSKLIMDGVQSCCDEVIVQFNPTILSQLTSISIKTNEGSQFTDISIQHLNAPCFLFESIQFNLSLQPFSCVGMLKLVDINPHLTELNLSWKLRWNDSESLISWASSCVLQDISVVFELPIKACGQFCNAKVSGNNSSTLNNHKERIVTFNTCQINELRVGEMLTHFADLTCIVVENLYLSPNLAVNVLPTMIQRHPNLTSITADLVYLPEDTRYLFACFPRLKYLTCVGRGPQKLSSFFDISPIKIDSECLKLHVSYNEIFSYRHPVIVVSELIDVVPRLKQVELPSNIRSADRPIIETACMTRGAELISV